MKDREYAGLCTAFLAGIAAGTVLMGSIGPDASSFTAALPLAVIFLLMVRAIRRGGFTLPWAAAVFALAGCFCALSAGVVPPPSIGFPVAERAALSLKGLIDSIPWPSETSAPLLKALLTGDRSGLSPEVTAAFRLSGAAHILALSGLHLGIIYLILSRTLYILGRFPLSFAVRYCVIISFSCFYTLMTGASPSLVRALLFIILGETARLLVRPVSPVRILLSAMVIQLAASPSVITSIGFQLSYLAMAGITLLYPRLLAFWPEDGEHSLDGRAVELGGIGGQADQSWHSRDGGQGGPVGFIAKKIWNASALTLSCQAFTAPLVWFRFRTLPANFLLTNLLALPLVSAAIPLSLAVLFLSALGICPHLLISAADASLSLLIRILTIIAGM